MSARASLSHAAQAGIFYSLTSYGFSRFVLGHWNASCIAYAMGITAVVNQAVQKILRTYVTKQKIHDCLLYMTPPSVLYLVHNGARRLGFETVSSYVALLGIYYLIRSSDFVFSRITKKTPMALLLQQSHAK